MGYKHLHQWGDEDMSYKHTCISGVITDEEDMGYKHMHQWGHGFDMKREQSTQTDTDTSVW